MSVSKTMRSACIAAALGAASAPLLAAAILPAWSQNVAATAVSISNFTFDPPTLTVRAGSTVTWTNKDDIPHGIAWTNNAFGRSKALDTNDSTSFTFATPGTYQYFCYIHPHMTGTVRVQAATGSGTAGGSATASNAK
jgi:plastocyanin